MSVFLDIRRIAHASLRAEPKVSALFEVRYANGYDHCRKQPTHWNGISLISRTDVFEIRETLFKVRDVKQQYGCPRELTEL